MSEPFVSNQKLLTICGYRVMPATDGGKKGIYLFEKFLAPHFELTMVSTTDNQPDESLSFSLKKLLSTSPWRYINPVLLFEISRIIRKEKNPHLLIEHCYFGWLGVLLKWFSGVQLIIHHHNIEATRFRSLKKWWWPILLHYEKFVSRQASKNFYKTDQDKAFAVAEYGVSSEKCFTVPFGTPMLQSPSTQERNECTNMICRIHGIEPDTLLFMFAASYGYQPNLQALQIILDEINPLLDQLDTPYKVIICGGGLPVHMNKLAAYENHNIIYAGFVDDIDMYFKGCDIFLNPVLEGGGIKTKLVEALACGQSAVSARAGAVGVPAEVCGNKLAIVHNNATAYLDGIRQVFPDRHAETPAAFFQYFSWSHIAERVSGWIKN